MRVGMKVPIVTGALVATLGVGAYLLNSDVPSCRAKGRDVPIPPVGAPADQVVRSYLDAVLARDSGTAKALSAPSYADREEPVDSAICNWDQLSNLKVDPPTPDYYGPGGYTQAVTVWTTFNLKQREVVSMPNGETAWSYLLVRNSDAERWRIIDEGIG